MQFTRTQSAKILSSASAAYLTKELDIDFLTLKESEQNAILKEAACLEYIEDHASTVKELLADLTDGVDIEPSAQYFLVKLKIRNGDYEERTLNLYNCDSEEGAVKLAMDGHVRVELEYPDGEDGAAYDCHGEIALSLHSVVEVSQFEAAILRKYI
ncbi:MAG: hypothetical protein HRT95_03765 [Moritella sp.]|uniref:hypothetical protein n=1 Tax=Moritella sp. TaxID=78556 RepID=UPI001D3574E3|nr:hypothetical protein [Moritella sp.]NQZ49322.1 hypothetical protein [Moritella sp.]